MKRMFLLWLIAFFAMPGAKPAAARSEPFVGQITIVGFNFCPKGWAPANGQLLPIAQHQALFSLLGTSYGGDGRTTFALPDLRGRVTMHRYIGRQYQGERIGSASVKLTVGQLPRHTHSLIATAAPAGEEGPTGQLLGSLNRMYSGNTTNLTPMSSRAIGATGGGAPVPLYQPSLVLNFCIATQGIFPPRD